LIEGLLFCGLINDLNEVVDKTKIIRKIVRKKPNLILIGADLFKCITESTALDFVEY